jgi:hypothetical protein
MCAPRAGATVVVMTTRRLVALLLIAVAADGLIVLSFFTEPGRVSEPSGSQASFLVMPPLLVALVLVVIARYVRRLDRLGSRASALVRSLFAAVAGVAGWMLAIAVVLATSADVAIDDRSLVLIAVAPPVAAATYCGWLDRRRPRASRRLGLGAALTGAIIGAWLGYGAVELAPLSAVVGAVAASNLALIARDVWSADDVPAGDERGRHVPV